MVRFFTDIDNTLLHSYRREIGENKRCVEYINGKIQSYMTEKSYQFLTSLTGIDIIPVTTRIKPQYDRLSDIMGELNVRYAIICNGGILLENGEINSKWLEQTYKLAEKAGNELKKCADIMSKLSDREVHTVEHIMSYVVCDDAETAEKDLKNNSDSTLVTVFRDNRKVYCVPSVINKGNAVKRFAEMFGECLSIGAGDGEQDISMLEYVDIPIAAQSIGSRIKNANKIVCDDSKVFTDSICNELLKLNI